MWGNTAEYAILPKPVWRLRKSWAELAEENGR